MKTAIYIEDGVLQLVLTPEDEHEKRSIDMFEAKKMNAEIFVGSFYDCRGGWIRQTAYHNGPMYHSNSDDKSIIIRVDDKKTESVDE